MAHPSVLKYKEDMTGVSPDNLVVDEPHKVGNRRYRILIPEHGSFYAAGVKIVDALTRKPLTANDYELVEYEPVPSKKSSKPVFSVILIKNQAIASDTFLFTGQYVGGEFSFGSSAIKKMYEDVMTDDRPVHWDNILGKPKEGFEPLDHLHDLGDVVGFEYLVSAVEALRRAMLMGDSASHDAILKRIDELASELDGLLDPLWAALNRHLADRDDPHDVTKEQVGLGNLPNATTYARTLDDTNVLLTAKAMADHVKSGDHDSRYLRLADGSAPLQFRERGGRIEVQVNGTGSWFQVYPPVWG